MVKIENLTNEPYQEHIILFKEEFEIALDLRYLPTVEKWFFDLKYKEFEIYGVKLALNTLHMESSNQPFDFIVLDESGTGLDPFRRNDWSDARCSLYLLEDTDMNLIRGVDVPI